MITGVVLSGGEGSRMGQDKGLVNLRGDPMVSYVIDAMLGLVDEIVISVAKGQSSKYDEYSEIGFEIVEDGTPGIGPLEGMRCALKVARGDYVLVSPCDTPFLKPGICQMLLSKANGRDGAVPMIKDRFEPVHGAFKKTAAAKAFEAALTTGKRKPSDAYGKLDIAFVDESSLRGIDPVLESFWNLNTPEDLRLAEEKVGETQRVDDQNP
jgi:molybdopterin-guanine dinucleotide biosynthesis protein A